jgi:hypothetical protein
VISSDRKNARLWLSQEIYIEKVLDRFNTSNAKPVSSPLTGHLKLSLKESPTCDKENEEIEKVPYASVVGSLMCTPWCARGLISFILLELLLGSFLIAAKNIGQL